MDETMSSIGDKSKSIIIVSATMTSLMVCAILLRVYTRFYIVKWIGIDDSLILVATVFALVENMAPVAGGYLITPNRISTNYGS
jgi:hypothetical protein